MCGYESKESEINLADLSEEERKELKMLSDLEERIDKHFREERDFLFKKHKKQRKSENNEKQKNKLNKVIEDFNKGTVNCERLDYETQKELLSDLGKLKDAPREDVELEYLMRKRVLEDLSEEELAALDLEVENILLKKEKKSRWPIPISCIRKVSHIEEKGKLAGLVREIRKEGYAARKIPGIYFSKSKVDGDICVRSRKRFDVNGFILDAHDEILTSPPNYEFLCFVEDFVNFFKDCSGKSYGFGFSQLYDMYHNNEEFRDGVDEAIKRLVESEVYFHGSESNGEFEFTMEPNPKKGSTEPPKSEEPPKASKGNKGFMSGLFVRKMKDRDACVFVEKVFDVDAFEKSLETEKDIEKDVDFFLFLPDPYDFFVTGRITEHYGFGSLEAAEEYNTNHEFKEEVDDEIKTLAIIREENEEVLNKMEEMPQTEDNIGLMSGVFVRKMKANVTFAILEKAFDVDSFVNRLKKEKDILEKHSDFLLFLPNPFDFFIKSKTAERYGFGHVKAIEEFAKFTDFRKSVEERIYELAKFRSSKLAEAQTDSGD